MNIPVGSLPEILTEIIKRIFLLYQSEKILVTARFDDLHENENQYEYLLRFYPVFVKSAMPHPNKSKS